MNRFKKALSFILALVMVFSVAAMMSGCDGSDEEGEKKKDSDSTSATDGTSGDSQNPGSNETRVYTVNIKTMGGMKMEGVDVYIYADEAMTDMKDVGKTDANGSVSFELPLGTSYVIELQGVPKGYDVKKSYSFAGNTASITLVSSLVKEDLSSAGKLGLGDVMYDFSVTTPAGEKVTLSEMLKEKDMVLLNFFFTTCGPCANEFPYMEQGYQMYKDDVGIIALDPLEQNEAVGPYQQSMGMTFPMAACPSAWSSVFGITGYPTSIIVDRYGVICLIEVGGLTSLRPFTSIFERFSGEGYKQQIFTSLDQVVTTTKPTVEMPSSEEIGNTINKGDIQVIYRPETEGPSAEYSWPFVITEKNGDACIKASNQLIEASYAIVYADVTLKAGQAVGFDYLISSEQGADILHVIVNGEPIYAISGVSAKEKWESAYPWVASEDGTYEIALCYIKDDSTDDGDDTVYIKNMRVCDVSDIDVATYLPRQAATSVDGFDYQYVDIVFNPNDGYYHVGSKTGPLLLADLQGYTQFNEEKSIWELTYNGAMIVDGRDYYKELEQYFSYASNSAFTGVCTVNKELADLLKDVAKFAGFDGTENEWLKMCCYYEAYGKNVKQLEDPIKGLATFSAYEAKLGKNVSTNYFYYNTVIMPRGKLAKFVPTKSGVYRITSHAETTQCIDGWIFDSNRNELLVYEPDERLYNDAKNASMVFYMKAGEAYYIDLAFRDVYEVGYIYYDIEYVAAEYDHFRLASPGYFTYDSDATGNAMYHLIAGGIDVVLGPDGYYYEDLGNGKRGSKLYADFTGLTGIFSNPIVTVDAYDENGKLIRDENGNVVKVKGMIDLGGFDFSKTEEDLYVLGVMEKFNNDIEATKAYLKEAWGEDYDANADLYQIEDVFAGRFHGKGEDYTSQIKKYISKMYNGSQKERVGCVEVDEELAELLQKLMDKYTFENVDNAWKKLCYYYDHLGPNG